MAHAPSILAALGAFELDPCSPVGRPWATAVRHLTVEDDGLEVPWSGRVWCNPPYSTLEPWLAKMAAHGHGTALTFARTDTAWFHRWVWHEATALLFLAGRITFCESDGTPAKKGHNSGGPSVLIAYGDADADALGTSGLAGAFVMGWRA